MNRISRIIPIALLLILGIASGLEALHLLDSVYQFRSPLMDNPPYQESRASLALSQKVVLVILDGLREDTSFNSTVMPVLNQMRKTGASAGMISHPPSFSEPGYATILTGAWPDINDGPLFNLDYGEIPTITQSTLFTVAKAARINTALSGYYWFDELVRQKDVDHSFYTPGEDREADRQVVDAALPWVDDPSIGLILIHIDQIDYAGHYEGGPLKPAWNEAATRSDGLLREIAAHIDFRTSTLVILSDHGHIDSGGHGGHEAITLHEPFIAVGQGIIPGIYETIEMVDVSSTIAVLLGMPIPSSSEGHPSIAMLNLTQDQMESLSARISQQQTNLVATYQSTVLNGKSKIDVSQFKDSQTAISAIQIQYATNGRWLRGSIILAILMMGSYLIFKHKIQVKRSMLFGTLIIIGSFHVLYGGILHIPYSFSAISDPMSFIIKVMVMTIAAALFGGAIYLHLAGREIHDGKHPSVQLMRFTGFVCAICTLPALLYFTLYGFGIRIILPNFMLLFMAMLSLVQFTILIFFGLIGIGIQYVIHTSRRQSDTR